MNNILTYTREQATILTCLKFMLRDGLNLIPPNEFLSSVTVPAKGQKEFLDVCEFKSEA